MPGCSNVQVLMNEQSQVGPAYSCTASARPHPLSPSLVHSLSSRTHKHAHKWSAHTAPCHIVPFGTYGAPAVANQSYALSNCMRTGP